MSVLSMHFCAAVLCFVTQRHNNQREGEVRLLPFSRAFRASHTPKISFSFPLERHAGQIISQTAAKNGMFLLVTLRFLSNLPISLIPSLFYFLHVSVVASIKGQNSQKKIKEHCAYYKRVAIYKKNITEFCQKSVNLLLDELINIKVIVFHELFREQNSQKKVTFFNLNDSSLGRHEFNPFEAKICLKSSFQPL